MVAAMDEAVGQIVAAVREAGIEKNTLFIFSSDNGGPRPGKVTSNEPYRAGKATVYEGGVRVCAFAKWDGHIKSGSKVTASLHMVDWYPTLIKLAGGKLGQKLPLDGRDLWPTLTAGAPGRDEIVHNCTPLGGAIRIGDWKLIVNAQAGEGDDPVAAAAAQRGKPERVELYNIATDPSEQHDAAAEHPEVVKRLRQRFDQLASEASPPKLRPKAAGFESSRVWGQAE
jgi:arylsulfatase A-like enzyme